MEGLLPTEVALESSGGAAGRGWYWSSFQWTLLYLWLLRSEPITLKQQAGNQDSATIIWCLCWYTIDKPLLSAGPIQVIKKMQRLLMWLCKITKMYSKQFVVWAKLAWPIIFLKGSGNKKRLGKGGNSKIRCLLFVSHMSYLLVIWAPRPSIKNTDHMELCSVQSKTTSSPFPTFLFQWYRISPWCLQNRRVKMQSKAESIDAHRLRRVWLCLGLHS